MGCFILTSRLTSFWQNPKSLTCLWLSPWKMGIFLWMCPGLLPKENCPSLSMRWSTEQVIQSHGLIQLDFQSHLLQTPLFWLDWMLGWSTLLEWEHCLKLELELGVMSKHQWHMLTVGVCWHKVHLHLWHTVSFCKSSSAYHILKTQEAHFARFSCKVYIDIHFNFLPCLYVVHIIEWFILTSLWQVPPESLVCQWPSQWEMGILLWLCPGPLPKVICLSLSMRWSTEQ